MDRSVNTTQFNLVYDFIFIYLLNFCLSAEFTSEPEALPERPDGQTSDGEAEVGNGVQGLPGVSRWLHEHAGEEKRHGLYRISSYSAHIE